MTFQASPEFIDWRERKYLSQFSAETIGLGVNVSNALTDVDGNLVSATLTRQFDDGTTADVNIYTATHVATGMYEVTFASTDTDVPGNYALVWDYVLSSAPQQYIVWLVVGQANPSYDQLSLNMRDIVDSVWIRFSDLIDSTSGGPNLQTYYQAHWSRGRVAQLLKIAVGRLNTLAQPFSTYTIDGVGGAQFPTAQWGALLESFLFSESIRHLIRSYSEQPMVMGAAGVTRLDRRDYSDRWREVLADEEAILKGQIDVFKISQMGLGRPRVLVAGGAYGRYAPTRVAGSVAARPRYFYRWY